VNILITHSYFYKGIYFDFRPERVNNNHHLVTAQTHTQTLNTRFYTHTCKTKR